jgi:hypothetical protein
VLQGGAGIDTASYADAPAGVTINLKTGIHTGIASGDTFDSIEAFIGSSQPATNSPVTPTATASMAAPAPATSSTSTSSAAVSVNLTTKTASGGDAQGDTRRL